VHYGVVTKNFQNRNNNSRSL